MLPDKIKCFQCFSYGQSYLLVASCVKAILPMKMQKTPTHQPWHLGTIEWEGLHVPVINLSLQPPKEPKFPHNHMMILQVLGKTHPVFVALRITQMARPIELKAHDLSFQGQAQDHLYPVSGEHLTGSIVDLRRLSEILERQNLLNE